MQQVDALQKLLPLKASAGSAPRANTLQHFQMPSALASLLALDPVPASLPRRSSSAT